MNYQPHTIAFIKKDYFYVPVLSLSFPNLIKKMVFDCSNGWLSPRIRKNFGLRNTINVKAKVMSLSAGLIVIAHDERTNMPLKQKKSLILSLFGSRNANIFHKNSCVHAPFYLFLSTFPVSTLNSQLEYSYILIRTNSDSYTCKYILRGEICGYHTSPREKLK